MSRVWFLLSRIIEDSFEQSAILSLDPAVSHELAAHHVPYKIFNDFCSEDKLRQDEDEYFQKQLLWFKELDGFISHHYGALTDAEGLGSIHINRLKYLIDYTVIQSRYLKAFLDQAKPRKIIFCETGWQAPQKISIYDFQHPLRRSLRPYLTYEARQRGFELEIRELPDEQIPNPPERIRSQRYAKIKTIAAQLGLKVLFEKFKYTRFAQKNGFENAKDFLFLDAGTESIDMLIQQAVRRGRVFLKQGDIIHEVGRQTRIPLKKKNMAEFPAKNVWKDFEHGPLMRWIEGYAPASREILRPYLEQFFLEEIPSVASQIKTLGRFMREYKIQAVISRASAGKNYPAALLAAKKLGVQRVCFQHSIGPLDMPDWVADELAFHDINFAMHPVSRDYFRSMPTFFENSCRVESWSAVLNKRARTRFRKPGKKETVFYVPAKLAGGAAHFNTPFYPATWYFEHQKKILNYFGQRPEYHFVYKHSSLQKWASSSVLRWLASQKFKNIEVIDGIFPKLMAQAHRVIFDYPSSGVFEAAAAGLPMLALYHRSMRLWEPMRQVFGPCLRPFSDTQEAVQTIHGYLNAPRRDYQIKLPAGDQENPFDVLEHDHEDQVR